MVERSPSEALVVIGDGSGFGICGVGGELQEMPFAICLGVVVILLLNVMEVFSVGGGALLDRPCMVFQRMCMLCLFI